MSDNVLIIKVYADRLVIDDAPTVRSGVEPMKCIVRWLDDETWDEVLVDDFLRMDRSPIDVDPPLPRFDRDEAPARQDVRFRGAEPEDVGASFRVCATRTASKHRLEERSECLLLGIESGDEKTVLKRS